MAELHASGQHDVLLQRVRQAVSRRYVTRACGWCLCCLVCCCLGCEDAMVMGEGRVACHCDLATVVSGCDLATFEYVFHLLLDRKASYLVCPWSECQASKRVSGLWLSPQDGSPQPCVTLSLAGSIIYQQTDLAGHCYYATCSLDCHVVRQTEQSCPSSVPPPAPTTSQPGSSPSAPVPVTTQGCPNAVPPRMVTPPSALLRGWCRDPWHLSKWAWVES